MWKKINIIYIAFLQLHLKIVQKLLGQDTVYFQGMEVWLPNFVGDSFGLSESFLLGIF